MKGLDQLNLTSPEVLSDPYVVYAELRREGGILWSQQHRAWLVSSYEFVRALLSHPAVSAEKITPFAKNTPPDLRAKIDVMQAVMKDWVVFNDPPQHTRLRKVLQKGFMPRNIALLEPKVRDATRKLLDDLSGRETIEFTAELAYRLPAIVLCDLFDIPREDSEMVRGWAEEMTKFILGSPSSEKYDATMGSLLRMRDYFAAKVEARKAAPRNNRDFVDVLLESQSEPGGLTDAEIVASLVLIVFGGHETTGNMIANAMRVLIDRKDLMRALQRDPTRIAPALEELMRFDGPTPVVTRVAKTDIEIGGEKISAGNRIFLILHAANHDESMFEHPETPNFDRPKCPHLQFGQGPHTCLGAPLARLEGRVVFEELLSRYADFELTEPVLEWRDELMTRGAKRLMVRMLPTAVSHE